MTFTETGFFCRDVLQATDAILQDGGGSSTLWVDGKVTGPDTGTVLPEALNGIFAKGAYWWYCRFGDADGWASLDQLTAAQ